MKAEALRRKNNVLTRPSSQTCKHYQRANYNKPSAMQVPFRIEKDRMPVTLYFDSNQKTSLHFP